MTQTEALKLALDALEEACEIVGVAWAWRDEKGRPAITAIKEALAQQCVCGEPDSAGTHRTDGPCLAPQPEQEPTRSQKMRDAGHTRRPKGWDKESDEPEHEPVAWFTATPIEGNGNRVLYEQVSKQYNGTPDTIPLFTTPPQQEPVGFAVMQKPWVGLTDDEFEDIELGCRSTPFGKIEAMRMVEAKLKEKNT